jgi:hypothetical protein
VRDPSARRRVGDGSACAKQSEPLCDGRFRLSSAQPVADSGWGFGTSGCRLCAQERFFHWRFRCQCRLRIRIATTPAAGYAARLLRRYLYPDIEYDYDYTQANVGVGFRNRYFFNAAYGDNWLGLRQRGYDYEFGFVQPLVANLELGINLGQTRVSRFLGGHFTHWDAGVSKLFDHVALDLRYYDSTLAAPTLLGDPGGNRWVVSLAYAISPRAR